MRKFLGLIPLFMVIAVFAPSLLIGRYAGNQPITAAGIAFMLPVFAYILPLVVVNRLTRDSYTYLSKADKRNYSLLVIGINSLWFIIWLFALFSGGMPLFIGLSTTAAFMFSVWDLLRLINGLQKASELNRIVWLHIFVPLFVAAAPYVLAVMYTHWPLVPNPLAIFFILRAALSAINRPLVPPLQQA